MVLEELIHKEKKKVSVVNKEKEKKQKKEDKHNREILAMKRQIQQLEEKLAKKTMAVQDSTTLLEEMEQDDIKEMKKTFGNTRPRKKMKCGYVRCQKEYIKEQKKLKAWKQAQKDNRHLEDEDWRASNTKKKQVNRTKKKLSQQELEFEELRKAVVEEEDSLSDITSDNKVMYNQSGCIY
jgi:hypothetical protein